MPTLWPPGAASNAATAEVLRLVNGLAQSQISLAGGMIAAKGRPVTAADAVEKVQEVLDKLKRRE